MWIVFFIKDLQNKVIFTLPKEYFKIYNSLTFNMIIFKINFIMPFFIRLFSKENRILSREILFNAIADNDSFKDVSIEKEETNTHNQFLVKKNGLELAVIIEMWPTRKKADAFKLAKITNSISHKKPLTSGKWIKKYLKKTELIYEFIPLLNLDSLEGWELFSLLYQEAWVNLRGIFQIKDEGFTNESGDIILWDFPITSTGQRIVAVKSFTGRWKTFAMNLESTKERQDFFKGKVPKNAKLLFRG